MNWSCRVPEQLSVAGCDDMSLARKIHPSLTTIGQPLAAMSEMAALRLIDSADRGLQLRGFELIPASIQFRESTGPAPK
jgi:LacI family transcriptional regulator